MFFITLFVIVIILALLAYFYLKSLIDDIFKKLIEIDKIFEDRYNDLSKAIAQFQKYMPKHRDLIIDVQKAKADAAKVSRPKNTKELAMKIVNENSLTLNLNYLIDKCDFQNIEPELKECVQKQVDYIQKISVAANEYNKLFLAYKNIKDLFPFNYYTKLIGINLDLDTIKTE